MSGMFDLTGKLAILTGGAGILGSEIARGLVDAGAQVAVVDRSAAAAQELAHRLGERAVAYSADIADPVALDALVVEIDRTSGFAEILINNAATKSEHFFAPFEDYPLDDWDAVMAVNLRAAMMCCQRFGGAMAVRGRGSVINTLSIYGVVAPDQRIYEGSWYDGAPINTPAVYSASKAALWGLTRYLASYWGAKGVRVNAIPPGGARSGQNDTFVERYSASVPLGRMAAPADKTGAVCFLASDAASYITGHNLVVDGGLTVW